MGYVILPQPGGLWKLKTTSPPLKAFEPIWLKIGMLVQVKPMRMRWFDSDEDRRYKFSLIVNEEIVDIIAEPYEWTKYMEDITPDE